MKRYACGNDGYPYEALDGEFVRFEDAMSKWKPITTAPTGQRVLVYGAKRLQWAVAEYTDKDGWEIESCSERHSIYPPTHWMPLPEPPK